MNKQKHTVGDAMDALVDDARHLMNSTTNAAGEKVGEARKRLVATLERGKEIYNNVYEKTVDGAKVFNEAAHKYPYQAIALGIGTGMLIGYFAARNAYRNHQSR